MADQAEVQQQQPPAEVQPAPPTSTTRTAVPGEKTGSARGAVPDAGGQAASVAVVTQNYSNYVQEIQGAFELLRQRAVSLQETGPAQIAELQNSIQPQTQELISALQETTPVQASPASISSVFSWGSVLLLASSLAAVAGAYVFSPIFGIFLGRFGSAILAYIAAPIAGYYLLKNNEASSDSEKRFALLSIAGIQGLLSGHALAYTYVSGSPLIVLTPVIVAFGYPLLAGKLADRTQLLGALLGGSLAVHVVLGAVTGSMTASYFIAAVFYSVAAGVVLQLAFKNLSNENQVHIYQLGLLGGTLLAKGLVHGVFGGEAPKN